MTQIQVLAKRASGTTYYHLLDGDGRALCNPHWTRHPEEWRVITVDSGSPRICLRCKSKERKQEAEARAKGLTHKQKVVLQKLERLDPELAARVRRRWEKQGG